MTIPVQRICRAHSDAPLVCRFVHQLTIQSGVRVAARRSTSDPGYWQIAWHDGPTVLTMRRLASNLGRAAAGVDLDHLTWQRTSRAVTPATGFSDDRLVDPPRTPAA